MIKKTLLWFWICIGITLNVQSQNINKESVLIKINDRFDQAVFKENGGEIRSQSGNILSAWVPQDQLSKLRSFPGITHMAVAQKVQQNLNKAVPDGRVDSVWQGINMPSGFSGKDVIIGFTDWGFDYTHPVFYDTSLVNYRVLRVWDQFKTSGPAPAGFSYGTEIIGKEALLEAQCDTSNVYGYNYHGNHVASIAAGSGGGTRYRGVAFDADLLFSSFLVDEAAVIDAFNWMYDVAVEEGKRLVINMSWGLYYMSNLDGTGLLAEAIESLSEQGVVFVTSGGNNGDVNFHIKHVFPGETDTLKTQIAFDSYGESHTWGQSISMISSPNSSFSFSLQLMNGSLLQLAASPFYDTRNGDRLIDTFLVINTDTIRFNAVIEESNYANDRPQVRLRVKKGFSAYKHCLLVTAPNGEFHTWNLVELTNDVGNWGDAFLAPATGWTAGDSHYGLGNPASIDCAITVAAHKARAKAPVGIFVGGEIADFSSYGPSIDHRVKPEISAPGHGVIAALSSFTDRYSGGVSGTTTFNGKAYSFVALSGTSMSSPFVAGVAALILQANPYLTPAQVKQILIETAYQDEFTGEIGPTGHERFGYGKVDAWRAVLKALETSGIHDYPTAQSRYSIYPNPAQSTLYISVQSDSPDILSEIYDLSGKLIEKHSLVPGVNQYTIANLAPGCYFIKITDGKSTVTEKLIKN